MHDGRHDSGVRGGSTRGHRSAGSQTTARRDIFVNRTGLVFAILAGNNRGSGRRWERPSSVGRFYSRDGAILRPGGYFRNEINGRAIARTARPHRADKRPPVLSRMKYQQWEIITREDTRENRNLGARDLTIGEIYVGIRPRRSYLSKDGGRRREDRRNCNFGPPRLNYILGGVLYAITAVNGESRGISIRRNGKFLEE